MNNLYSCVRRGLRSLVAGIVGVLVSAAASAVDWTIQDLGTLGGIESEAFAINNRGQVVGVSSFGDTRFRAFLYDGSVMRNLGSLVGGTFSSSGASAINIRGQVVGGGSISDNAFSNDGHAILFDSTGVHDLGTLGGWCCSAANGINASGQVVGESYLSGNIGSRAFLYDGTGTRDLGTLGGTHTQATGINASGQVVGYGEISGDNNTHAFFHNGTAMLDLGTPTL